MANQPEDKEFGLGGVSGSIVPAGATAPGATDLAECSFDSPLSPPTTADAVSSNAFSVSMLLRAKWWILGVSVLVSAVVLPCIWLFVSPEYRARASIRVSPVVSRIVFKTEDNGFVPLYQSFLNTQVSIILGPTVLQRVLDRDDIRQSKWYKEPVRTLLGHRSSHLELLGKTLKVAPRRNTELIDVSMVARDASDAKLIVDAVVDAYKTYSGETMRENDIRRLEALIQERDALQKEIDGLVATKFRLTSLLGTSDPETFRTQLSNELNRLEIQYESMKRTRTITEWDASRQRRQLTSDAENDVNDADSVTDAPAQRYASDLEWRRFQLELQMAGYELATASGKYGERHPRIQDLSSGVQYAERLLREREHQLDEAWRAGEIPSLPVPGYPTVASAYAQSSEALAAGSERLGQQMELLSKDIERKRNDLTDAGEIAKEIAHYDEDLRYKRELYEVVRQRLTAFEMESKAPARIGIADYAVRPSSPYRDRRIVFSAMALCGAMVMGAGVGYLKGTTDPRIHDTRDVRAPMQVPFLGKLPLISDTSDLTESCEPAVVESIRMVRTALLKRLGGSGSYVVLITSSSSRAGKTSVAVLLTRSLAQLGKRTLLVEADLRRPSIARRLKFEARAGLAAVLTGAVDDDEVIVPTNVARFDVLPAGCQPRSFNYELLANGVFSACLNRWKTSYDFIVLDSPPIYPVADARILAGQADGTIMVLRSAHCRRADVFQAYADLLAGGGRVLGSVFIGPRSESEPYGDYAPDAEYRNDTLVTQV